MQRFMRPLVSILAVLAALSIARAEDLNIPSQEISNGKPDGMMRRYLLRQTERAVERWQTRYEKIQSPEDIKAYQKSLREKFLKAIGGLPERTPLESHVTGTILRTGYRVEKVIFQSRPKHHVTALLFLPDSQRFSPPYPGVIVPCGHSFNGKGCEEYQTMGALLAINGMAALIFDPIDQGERGQYLGEDGWPKLKTMDAHTMVGVGSILLGRNTARFMIWDGMCAIDYLQSRPEINPNRIGCTGNSGGGTQTSYLMALDDRIIAAAPSCYITSISRLMATEGPQDAEQNIYGQLNFGLDHADYLMLRAPSPVLICCATKDFFDIGGTWNSFRYAKRLYTRMGFAERVGIVENDEEHGFNILLREGAARWMSRWLLQQDRPIVEPKIKLLDEKEYQCTADGMVMTLPGARSVYDLNQDYEDELAKQRAAAWASGDRVSLLERVRKLAGIRRLVELPKPQVEIVRTIGREGYTIEQLLIQPEDGVTLSALCFLPDKRTSNDVVLYLHTEGKTTDAGVDGPIENFVQSGAAVLAVDLRGTGQTQADRKRNFYTAEYQDAMMAYLLGRSYIAMRTEDILASARYAADRFSGARLGGVLMIAIGNIGIPALHAAALEPQLFKHLSLSQTLSSWSNVIHNRLNHGLITHVVHGALRYYDLPDLAATLDEKITIEQPVNAVGAANTVKIKSE